jgi:hypothetical protein
MMEESNVAFWKGVKPGDMVTLSDAQTIIARMKENKGVTPENFEITEVLNISQTNGFAVWLFFRLGATNLQLVAKIVDKNLALSVLRSAPGWDPSTRKECVDSETLFMFNAPTNLDNFEYEDLTYVAEMNESDAEVNDDKDTIFYRKPQGEALGKANVLPAKSGVGQQIATIVEYVAESNKGYIDTEFMILELGTKAFNGVIHFLVGRPIASIDVNVMQRK